MAELLLELLTEEIPARMQARAGEDLLRLAGDKLAAAGLAFTEAQTFVTPRRLTLVVTGLPTVQVETTEERRGPRVGSPQSAVEGFLRAAGVKMSDCERRETDKGTFYFAVIRKPGGATADYFPGFVHAILADFPWPKSMRFPAAPFRWVRPLTSVLCLFDGKTVPLDLGAVPVGDKTRGHRFLAPAAFSVRDFDDYRRKLHDAHVGLDAKERRRAIELALQERAGEVGLTVKDDPGLLDEVTGLVEWPVVRLGTIDPDFMDLPPEVLTTSMRTHQKYFACLDRDGGLAPRFLLVANNIADDGGGAIVAGNERVLRARLADARFFWDLDRGQKLEERLPRLAERVFYQGLGTMADKAERLSKLASEIAYQLAANLPNLPDRGVALRLNAKRAGLLAKADLTSAMVGEFPELQGVMGRYYAEYDGDRMDVADAIADHYAPQGPNDRCPAAPVSVAVAIADKIDTLVGFFILGEKPTGSKDPFALRRAALGVIRLILENELRLSLRQCIRRADAFWQEPNGGNWGERPLIELLDFFGDRLKVHLRELGMRHDLIAAIFALGEDDLVRLMRRVEALEAFLETPEGSNLLTAYRRAANIVGIEEKRDGVIYEGKPDMDTFITMEEATLAKRLDQAQNLSAKAFAAEDFGQAMAALAGLRGQIDDFFTKITVNDKDPDLRANRLKLLARIRDTFDRVADFSRIEG
ncbi:MAG TPA: glycine--tRNA ligase subunit beta [Stellaceae bacterium]|nr:glycine--tRNA ligase subunit beta [Stellaceae bacterium]